MCKILCAVETAAGNTAGSKGLQILKYKRVTKTTQNSMVFIQVIIYLLKIKDGAKRWGIYNKSCWVWISKDSLDSIICECWKCNMISFHGKSFLEYTNSFSPNYYEKNDKIFSGESK